MPAIGGIPGDPEFADKLEGIVGILGPSVHSSIPLIVDTDAFSSFERIYLP